MPSVLSLAVSVSVLLIALNQSTAYSAPLSEASYPSARLESDAEDLLQLLTRLVQLRNEELPQEQKRGLDLGLSRGFSGSAAAKHLMGLAAANYAGGPGRRRRNAQ